MLITLLPINGLCSFALTRKELWVCQEKPNLAAFISDFF